MTTNGATAAPTATAPRRVIGVAGLKNLGGRVQEEYLQVLQFWERAVKVYLEMRDEPTVATLLNAIKLPLLSADFDVTPFSDSAADAEAADWLWENMTTMSHQSWRSHVSDALEALDFGFYVGEIVFEKREDGRLWLGNIEPRGQETLYRWEFDERDNMSAFIQQDPDTGVLYRLPAGKLVHIVLHGRKGNPQGTPLLRSLYRPWRFLKDLENMEGIGLERNVGGMPVATLPEEPITDDDIAKVETALKNLRYDEEMYLLVPHGMEVHAYGWEHNVAQLSATIERKQKEILMRGFAQFLKLGMDNVGTQALVKGSQDFFALSLRSIQQELLERWNQQLVPLLFALNPGLFDGMSGLPEITWNDPGAVDPEALLNSWQTGVNAKVLTPTREDEEHIRAVLDFPDLPEGEGEGPRDDLGMIETAGGFGSLQDNPGRADEVIEKG